MLGQVTSLTENEPESAKPEGGAASEPTTSSSKMTSKDSASTKTGGANAAGGKVRRKMIPQAVGANGVKVAGGPNDTGVSSIKHNNTRATMILYFCIMTVLMCCCLGRCLVVPLS